MDAKQEFYDKLFEEPSSIMGLRNKYSWLRAQLHYVYFDDVNFEVIRNVTKEVTDLLKLIPMNLRERSNY